MPATAMLSVLVVEDDGAMRYDLAEHLQRVGYRVFEAANSDEAIDILEREDAIRIVFTDVQMPGDMDGIALAAAIRKRWPPTLIVICSAIVTSSSDVDLADIHILAKPYNSSELGLVLSALEHELASER